MAEKTRGLFWKYFFLIFFYLHPLPAHYLLSVLEYSNAILLPSPKKQQQQQQQLDYHFIANSDEAEH